MFRGTSISKLQTIPDTSDGRGVSTIIKSIHSNQMCQFSQQYNIEKKTSIKIKNFIFILKGHLG